MGTIRSVRASQFGLERTPWGNQAVESQGLRLGARPDLGEMLQRDPGVYPRAEGLGVYPRAGGLEVYPRAEGLRLYPRVVGPGEGHKPGLVAAGSRVPLKLRAGLGMALAGRVIQGRHQVDPPSTLAWGLGDPSVPWSLRQFQ